MSEINSEHVAAAEHLDNIEDAEKRLTAWRLVAMAAAIVWMFMAIMWILADRGSVEAFTYEIGAWAAIATEIIVMFWPVAKAEKDLRELGCANCAEYDYDRTYPE